MRSCCKSGRIARKVDLSAREVASRVVAGLAVGVKRAEVEMRWGLLVSTQLIRDTTRCNHAEHQPSQDSSRTQSLARRFADRFGERFRIGLLGLKRSSAFPP